MNYQERSQTEILAENLSEIMLRKDLSQNALARKIDVSPTVVNKWCRGISMPRNDKIDRLCQALNITRADLLQDKTTAPNLSVPAAHPVKILGTICAGEGITADENLREMFFNSLCIPMYHVVPQYLFFNSTNDIAIFKRNKNGHPDGHPFLS